MAWNDSQEPQAARSGSRPVYVGLAVFFAVLLGAYFVYQIREIFLVLLLTLLFTIILSGPVNYLGRKGVPRGLGVVAVLGALTLAAWVTGVAIAPVVQEQSQQLVEDFPQLVAQTQTLAADLQGQFGLDLGVDQLDIGSLMGQAQSILSADVLSVAAGFGASLATAVSLGVVLFIGVIYLSVSPAPVVNGFVALFPAGNRQRVREVLSKTYNTVQNWFLGQLTAMVFIGIFSAVALSVIGIQFAVLLGVLSGLISFIPFVGPVISVIPPVLLALLAGEPISAVWVIVAYIVIQQIESNILQPVVMSRAVALHPAVVLFAIIIMGTLFGFIGLLLAIPLVAAIQVLVQELWVRRMDAMGEDPDPPSRQKERKHQQKLRRLARIRRALGGLRRSAGSAARGSRSALRRARTRGPRE